MQRYTLTFFLLSFLLISYRISLAGGNDSLRTYHLQDSIVVVAKRFELPLKSITNSMDLIRSVDYSNLANHSALQLIDIISPEAYVLDKKVIGYGVGPYAGGSIHLRGMGGKPNSGILILINGRPDFMGIFGHPLPDVYGLSSVEKVEVIKGPSSTVYGSNAMGGTINIITNGPMQNQIFVKSQAGNFNTFNQILKSGYDLGQANLSFEINHQKTDGHIDSTGFESWMFATKFTRKFSQNWKFSLEGRYVPYGFDDPQMGQDFTKLGKYAQIRRGMADLEITGNIRKLKNSFHLYSNLGHHRFNDGFESHDFTYGFSSYQHLKITSQLQLSSGIDAIHYGGKAKNVVFYQAPPKPDLHIVNSLGGYLMAFCSPRAQISFRAGIRYQYVSLNIQKVSPTVGLAVLPFNYLKLFASYNQGFRVPTLQELFLFPPSNENLESEDVASYESGLNFYFAGKNYIQFTYFKNNIKNIIQLVPNRITPSPVIYKNSGSANQWGVESSLSIFIIQGIIARLSYSYLQPDQLTAFNPKNMLKYLITIKMMDFDISIFGKYIAGLYANNNQIDKLENYHIANLMVSYPFRRWIFNIQLRNVFDSNYEILPGYQAPRFTFLAGVSWRWPN